MTTRTIQTRTLTPRAQKRRPLKYLASLFLRIAMTAGRRNQMSAHQSEGLLWTAPLCI